MILFALLLCKIDGFIGAFVAADKDIIDYLNTIYVLKMFTKHLPMIQTVGSLKRLELLTT
jgi:glycine C-acetyltransferase